MDVLQIPAFLCRQTDLLIAAAKTQKIVNIKKGQFVSPQSMQFAVQKVIESGNNNVMLTERGTSFGYGDLIVDPRSFVIMAETGYPVIIDATHAVQKPAMMGSSSGGEARMAPFIARTALSTGMVGGVFIETHPEPLTGGSDIHNMIPLMYMEEILKQLQEIDNIAKANKARYEDWKQEGMPIDEILKKLKK